MNFRVSDESALISAVKRSRNDIALLIGSPLSAPFPSEGKGVPGVGGILEIIREYLSLDSELFDEYSEKILDRYSNDNEIYQKSFEFLADYTDPNTPNEIIRKAVLCSFNPKFDEQKLLDLEYLDSLQSQFNEWHIPPATEYLARLLKNNSEFKGPVLTTNFDPLLSIALNRIGYFPNRTVLHGDGSLEQLQSSLINIVHMHGFWTSTDTMHTQSQLKLNRPKLKSSLSRILKNKTLLVLGYSGWDDIFMQALRDVIEDESANLDVIWAFYESDENTIQKKYESLINAVQPAIGRNRFRMYSNINCHIFLPKLYSKVSKEEDKKTEVKETVQVENHGTEKIDKLIFSDDSSAIPPWFMSFEPAHMHIREVERSEIFEALQKNDIVSLVSDWGLSKDEFICTLVEDINSPIYKASIYRVDLSGVLTKPDLFEKIESDFGVGIQNFINNMSSGKHLLYLDNFDSNLIRQDSIELWSVINWLANILVEYNSECKIIVCSKTSLAYNIAQVRLSKLEEFDIRSYITNHSKIKEQPDEHLIESLTELSRGIPSFIDKYINDLELLSIDDIYDLHFSPEANRQDSDSSYPSELKTRVRDLSISQEEHSRRSYELLKTLSILEFGDSFTNIKRSNPNFNFRPSHLKELYSLELVETLSISKSFLKTTSSIGDDKLHCLPPIVRSYVYSQLDAKEIYQIVERLADVHLGKNWRVGTINLCKVAKDLLAESSKSTGSTHLIIIHLLRCSIELNNGRLLASSLKICESFCMYLSSHSRNREIVKFVEQIKVVIRESDKIPNSLQLDIFEGEARRMIGDFDKAGTLLLSAYEQIKSHQNPEKTMLKKVLSSLCYFYKREKDLVKANLYANELLSIDKNNTDARYIVAVTSKENSLKELKILEGLFRGKKEFNSANNLAYVISEKENSDKNKIKWLDKILSERDDQYNKIRAVIRKGEIIANSSENMKFSSQEISLLHISYFYTFSQKIAGLFNRTHRVLWEYYSQKENHVILLQLFRQSSLFWRIYENLAQEQIYSSKMLELINELLPATINLSEYRYVTLRVNQLSDN